MRLNCPVLVFVIMAALATGTAVHGVDTGAISVDKKPPYVHFHGSKAKVLPADNSTLNK